jgi:hypothetical protein
MNIKRRFKKRSDEKPRNTATKSYYDDDDDDDDDEHLPMPNYKHILKSIGQLPAIEF